MPSANARDALRELRRGMRDLDPIVLAPRIAAIVFLVGGLLALAASRLGPANGDYALTDGVAVDAVVLAAVAMLLPWQRWPVRMQVVVALAALMLVA